MKILEVLQVIIAIVTFVLWVAFVVADLFFGKPIDQGVFVLTMAVFAFVFGPGVFKGLTGWRNGNGNGKDNGKGP